MSIKVVFSTGVGDAMTGGQTAFEIEARSLRSVFSQLEERFPGIREYLEEETTVAIDGELHESGYLQPLRDGCEIYFLPRIEAG